MDEQPSGQNSTWLLFANLSLRSQLPGLVLSAKRGVKLVVHLFLAPRPQAEILERD